MLRSLKLTAMIVLLVAAAAALPACNTVKGAGEDLQSASENTERAIDNATR
jgi:predicted small secreted protein